MTKLKNTDEELITILKEYAIKLGRTPNVREMIPLNGMPSGGTYVKRFGNWEKTLEKAELKIDKVKWDFNSVFNLFSENNCELISKEFINGEINLDYKCVCGNNSKIRLYDFIKGQRCRECGTKKRAISSKFTYEYVNNIFKENDCELLESEYLRSQSKLKFKCACGNISEKSLSEFQRGRHCAKCGNLSTARKLSHKLEDINDFYLSKNCILISKEYINQNTKLQFICACGNTHKSYFDAFKRCPRCPECRDKVKVKKTKHSHEFMREMFEAAGCKLLSEIYTGSKMKMDYICVCGETSSITYSSFSRGVRCFKCGLAKIAKINCLGYELVNKLFEDSSCTLLTKKYINNKQLLEFICECGNVGNRNIIDFRNGIRCNVCTKARRSTSRKGRKFPNNSGENNPQWDFSKTPEEREKGRFITEYKQCRTEVYKRDKYTCQCCGDNKGGNLAAHHIDGWDWCKDRRFDLDNIITLCDLCHDDFHHFYGFGGNTREQWEEYLSELYAETV